MFLGFKRMIIRFFFLNIKDESESEREREKGEFRLGYDVNFWLKII